jgi:hypothetical protein
MCTPGTLDEKVVQRLTKKKCLFQSGTKQISWKTPLKFFSLNVSPLRVTMIEQVFVVRGLVDHKFPSNKISSLVITRFIVIDAFEKAGSFSAVTSLDDC